MGQKGGKARAEAMTPERRAQIAKADIEVWSGERLVIRMSPANKI
jgi:hypothetical protein